MTSTLRNIAVVAALALSVSTLVAQPPRRPPQQGERRDQRQPSRPPRDERRDQRQPSRPPRDDRRVQPRPVPPPPEYRHPDPPSATPNYPRRTGKWQVISEHVASGNAIEVGFSGGGFTECKIQGVSGRVCLNTVVVRRSSRKQSLTARTTLERGNEWIVPIDRSATGIRISSSGGGSYKVWVR